MQSSLLSKKNIYIYIYKMKVSKANSTIFENLNLKNIYYIVVWSWKTISILLNIEYYRLLIYKIMYLRQKNHIYKHVFHLIRIFLDWSLKLEQISNLHKNYKLPIKIYWRYVISSLINKNITYLFTYREKWTLSK